MFRYKYHSARYGKKSGRGCNIKPTSEKQKFINKKISGQKRLWTICDNFEKDDYFITLTYRRDERPDSMDEAMECIKKFLAKLSRILKKRNTKLSYMQMTERGTKGGVHHHLLIKNRFDIGVIFEKNLWPYGSVNIQRVYSDNLLKLGMYMLKGDSEASEKRYSQSRDIVAPEPEVKIIAAEKWTEVPKPVKGYEVINVSDGVDMEYGYPYQEYIMVKRE